MGPWSAGAHAHVVVADLSALELDPADRHHLARVLRIRPGEAVTATDGRGRWLACVAPASWPAGGDSLEPAGEIVVCPPRLPEITIGVALTKGDKPELAVQKLTELGVDRVVLVAAEHSVVRWDPPKVERHLERLRAIAREALMQSRGAWLPRVDGVVTLAALAAQVPGLALADAGGSPPGPQHMAVAIGPEGGWSAAERDAVTERIALGDTVLRAETAAVACMTLLGALRSGLVVPAARSLHPSG